jgi:2,4-dienoyl-CoA reductase-like NADH-dependent reductase (Old Yellow Enzyme family)
MQRNGYKIFSEGKFGNLTLSNRLVRSATWDPSILKSREMSDEVLDLYRNVALGGIGLIITGDFPTVPEGLFDDAGKRAYSYEDVRIEGLGKLVDVVHGAAPRCKIVAQLSGDYFGTAPSDIPSPYTTERDRPLSTREVRTIAACLAEGIVRMKEEGFDGVQLHAAHGGLLSRFLSPHTNRRADEYGGPAKNRARIVKEAIGKAREKVGNFVILIKMNGTDYLEGGTDIHNFPELAEEIASAGVDGIEISGGMWDCLVRSEEELGFRPVPSPESHTRIKSADKQSYFLKYAEKLSLDIPVILVGGNRDVERLEEIVQRGKVDFISLCRPLISEPDLPNRWLEGRGSSSTDCISCNSCIYDMIMHPGREEPGIATCLFKHDREQYKIARRWIASWVGENRI